MVFETHDPHAHKVMYRRLSSLAIKRVPFLGSANGGAQIQDLLVVKIRHDQD